MNPLFDTLLPSQHLERCRTRLNGVRAALDALPPSSVVSDAVEEFERNLVWEETETAATPFIHQHAVSAVDRSVRSALDETHQLLDALIQEDASTILEWFEQYAAHQRAAVLLPAATDNDAEQPIEFSDVVVDDLLTITPVQWLSLLSDSAHSDRSWNPSASLVRALRCVMKTFTPEQWDAVHPDWPNALAALGARTGTAVPALADIANRAPATAADWVERVLEWRGGGTGHAGHVGSPDRSALVSAWHRSALGHALDLPCAGPFTNEQWCHLWTKLGARPEWERVSVPIVWTGTDATTPPASVADHVQQIDARLRRLVALDPAAAARAFGVLESPDNTIEVTTAARRVSASDVHRAAPPEAAAAEVVRLLKKITPQSSLRSWNGGGLADLAAAADHLCATINRRWPNQVPEGLYTSMVQRLRTDLAVGLLRPDDPDTGPRRRM